MNIYENLNCIPLKDDKSPKQKRIEPSLYYDLDSVEDNIGWIVQSGYCYLDFDDSSYGDVFLEIVKDLKLKTIMIETTRGKHFLFKTNKEKYKDWTHINIWCGLMCDSKGNGTNESRTKYEVIKFKGKLRNQVLLNCNSLDEVDILPKWCYGSTKAQYLRLKEGEGRDNTLFNYIITLMKNDFTKSEVIALYQDVIMKHVLYDKFDKAQEIKFYDDRCYDSIQVKNNKNKLKYFETSDMFIERYSIVSNNNRLIFYDEVEDRYIINDAILERYILNDLSSYDTLASQRRELMTQIELKAEKKQFNRYYIILKDKLYNIFTGELFDIDRNILCVIKYDYAFMDDEHIKIYEDKNGKLKEFIDFCACNNDNIRRQLFEMIGCALVPNVLFQKAFILLGSGGNGKSVLLSLIKNIMGMWCSTVNIKDFSNIFSLAEVFDGLCNIVDDLGKNKLEDTDTFKTIVGGGSYNVSKKYANPYTATSMSTQIIASNELPYFNDTSHGIIRRLQFIDFDAKVSKPNINLLFELLDDEEGMSWLITKSLIAWREAYERGSLTSSYESEVLLMRYQLDINSCLEFILDTYLDEKYITRDDNENITNYDLSYVDIDGLSFKDVYAKYTLWCLEKNKLAKNTNNFAKQFNKTIEPWYEIKATTKYDAGNRINVRTYRRK
jgi:putative DNA primase/helicase